MIEKGTERIFTAVKVELRAATGSAASRSIGGYAAVFNRYSQPLGGYVERIAPSFFNKSRGDGWPGVVCRYNHDDAYLRGATRGGTLQLSIDASGLDYTVDLPECRGDVLELVQRGDIGHSSFAFQCVEDDWSWSERGSLRTLVSGRLIDVAPVCQPAYPDSTVGLRSLAARMSAPLEDVIALAGAGQL